MESNIKIYIAMYSLLYLLKFARWNLLKVIFSLNIEFGLKSEFDSIKSFYVAELSYSLKLRISGQIVEMVPYGHVCVLLTKYK